MAKLVFHKDKITDVEAFVRLCPFGALKVEASGEISADAGCKMCKICVKRGGGAATVIEEEAREFVDKSKWSGIAVYVDHEDGKIHPVTLELIGKARALADKIGHKVYCVFMGSGIKDAADELLHYGVDKVFVYDNKNLKNYIPEAYTAVFEDFINNVKPTAILVGATAIGRELAPRVAARFKTGLTADCTILDINENTDLVQIRPAFGGNIMAQIVTPNNRPQLATVRYKVMNAPERSESISGEKILCDIDEKKLETTTQVLEVSPKERVKTIESADVIVAVGRGVKSKEDIKIFKKLADLIGGEIACTRPLVEAGWMDAKHQIGLSGRTVRPRLIIACGISGAVQFTAGMNNSEYIFAINKDQKAPIFKVANYGLTGDIYEIVPQLIKRIEEGR
ncbi:MAG: electron transfer flavoprotein subunit alpha/FixB family protein [Oscillospiraceae bacterium]|nr:electron transfer flavoprotein subunit alpha/FixB family protein [Oscillospiraceae bacterium]